MTDSQDIQSLFSIERLQKDNGGGDYVYIRFPRTANRGEGQLIEPLSIVSSPKKLLNRLDDLGAQLPKVDRGEFIAMLVARLPDNAGILTVSTGWKGTHPERTFLLPDGVVGTASFGVVLTDAAKDKCVAADSAGTLEDWLITVAAPAAGSSIATAAILTALAGPLFTFSGLSEGFILNFAGRSSSGKTTANRCGASVWGNPTKILGWNATARGLAELAAAHNDLSLILDDAEQADENPKKRLQKLNEVTHTLTSGKGKVYSRVVSGDDRLPKLTFNCIVLSSSPRTIEADSRLQKRSRTDGDRVRLLEVEVPDGSLGGIWDSATGTNTDRAQLSEAIVAATAVNFGKVGRSWAAYLVERQKELADLLQVRIGEFRASVAPAAGDINRRICGKIGLLYAAGLLAREAGFLPWSDRQIFEATRSIYRAVIRSAFGDQLDPVLQVERLLSAIRSPKVLKLPKIGDAEVNSSLKCDGYIDREKARIYIRLDAFERVFYSSRVSRSAQERDEFFDFLTKANALKGAGATGSFTHDVRVGGRKQKFIVFRTRKLFSLVSKSDAETKHANRSEK